MSNRQRLKPPTRVATQRSVCCAPGCLLLIEPGLMVTKRPGGGWKHADCATARRKRTSRKASRS